MKTHINVQKVVTRRRRRTGVVHLHFTPETRLPPDVYNEQFTGTVCDVLLYPKLREVNKINSVTRNGHREPLLQNFKPAYRTR